MSEDSVCSRTTCTKISLCPLGLCWLAAVYFSRTVAQTWQTSWNLVTTSSSCAICTAFVWFKQVICESYNEFMLNSITLQSQNSDQWSIHRPIQGFQKWVVLKLKAKSRPWRWSITCLKCSRLHLWNGWGDNLPTFYRSTRGLGHDLSRIWSSTWHIRFSAEWLDGMG